MAVTRFDELAGLAGGETITVEGRYERWQPGPGPTPITTARIVLAGGGGVLLGRYATPESRRPDDELARCEAWRVRVTGTFQPTRPWPGPGPMPGVWTGGGPQLVDLVAAPEMLVADPPPAPVPTSPPATVSPDPPPSAPPTAASPPRRPAPPRVVGRLARRSLAGGRSRLVTVVPALVGLAFAIATVMTGVVLEVAVDLVFAAAAAVLLAAFVGVEWLLVRVTAARALAELAATPWSFDVAAYVALLDRDRLEASLCVEVELGAPPPPDAVAGSRALVGAEVRWRPDRRVEIASPPRATREPGHPRLGTRATNAPLHRWYARLSDDVLAPLHATYGIVAIRITTDRSTDRRSRDARGAT